MTIRELEERLDKLTADNLALSNENLFYKIEFDKIVKEFDKLTTIINQIRVINESK